MPQGTPEHADALHLLGVLAHLGGRDDAQRWVEAALAIQPGRADFLNTLGLVHQARGRPAEAEACFRQVLSASPGHAAAHANLGIAMRELGRLEEAEDAFRESLRLDPLGADAHNNLGNLLKELGRVREAEASLRRAVELRPGFAEAHAALGAALRSLGRPHQAEECARRAIALKPEYAEAHNDLGVALFALGRLEEAERSYRQALALDPGLAIAQGNLVYLMNCTTPRSPGEIYAEHRAFASRFCPPVDREPHGNAAEPGRRLRIGYLSGDFRHHSVAFFIEPVLANHDRACVETFCYSNCAEVDEVTERLRAASDHWREVHRLEDEDLVRMVRADGIDILVDLSGYTARNRLPALARKPAPVQATWLGYLNTTGLAAVDYRITDGRANPPGMLDSVNSERLVRLPDSQWCYRPPEDAPEVAPRPEAGEVTFASFSILGKLSPDILALWGRLLARLPAARLLLVANGVAEVPAEFAARLAGHGIPRDRLRVAPSLPFAEYLALHGEADIVLDTFPFTGGTTTCHALWMGVPVVTLAGDTSTSRGGASLLGAIGLEELVARTPEEYLEIACALALDSPRRQALRRGMRERLRGSPLMDAERFTRHLEEAYREMWRAWCAERAGRSPVRRLLARLRQSLLGG